MIHAHSRIISAALAVIMVIALVFAPGMKASAEGTGSSAELNISLDGLDISAKAYADMEQMVFALLGSLGSEGQTIADAAIYLSAEALAVESKSFLDQVYGVDLTKYAENLAASVFAPDSGSSFALDEETFAMLQGGIQIDITPALSQIDVEAIAALGMALGQHFSGLGTVLMDSAEISMAPKTLNLATGDVAVSKMTVTFGPEALGAAISQFVSGVAADEALKPAIAEAYDMLAASGALTVSEELEGMTGAQIADMVWEVLPQIAEEAPAALAESGVAFAFTASTTKDTNEVVAAGLAVTIEDETMTMDVTFANGCYGFEMYVPGEDTMAAWCILSQNDADGFAISFAIAEGEDVIASLGLVLDYASGVYALSIDDGTGASVITGTFQSSGSTTVITVDQVDGQDIGNISLTLRGEDDLTVPAFTEILTMSEEEITELAQFVMSVATSIVGE